MILHCSIEELVEIIKSHIPHPEDVQAIMLYGSRADGRAHERSDYDLAIIQSPCATDYVKFIHDDMPYSCYFYPPDIATAENMNSRTAFFCFRSKPIYDPTGIGTQFAKIADEHVERASQTSPERQEQIENHLAHLMQKAKDIDAEAKLAAQGNLPNTLELEAQAEKSRIDCLFLSLDYLFLYHGMPDVGKKRELEVLLRDDPVLFDLFVQAVLPGATFEDAYAWFEAAKQEPFKANSFNVEFDEPAKITTRTATNRQGQTYAVRQMFLSYKYGLKPRLIEGRRNYDI